MVTFYKMEHATFVLQDSQTALLVMLLNVVLAILDTLSTKTVFAIFVILGFQIVFIVIQFYAQNALTNTFCKTTSAHLVLEDSVTA